MARALLVNGAVEIGGSPAVPNAGEGWGRINLENVIDSGASALYRDQLDVLGESGEVWSLTVRVADPDRPLKVTLAWSDAPGAVSANPALVNNLDLVVENGGSQYRGNAFSNGESQAGGNADALNNLENVIIGQPAETATIRVEAASIAGDGVPFSGDGSDQDFALVCSNCHLSTNSLEAVDELAAIGVLGQSITYTVDVTNTGATVDSFQLTVGDHRWPTTAGYSTIGPLAPGQSDSFEVTVTVGRGAADSAQVTITSLGDPLVWRAVRLESSTRLQFLPAMPASP
jgi:hypothetical protein